jgi:ABC-type nitrate/sulfonate/bicarbonate transport system substrate-binding protein
MPWRNRCHTREGEATDLSRRHRRPKRYRPARTVSIAGAFASIAIAIAALPLFGGGAVGAQEPTLRVNVFPGASNIAIFMGIESGTFAKRGLTIEILNTPNSDEQRAGLAAGTFEIAHAAVDNAVAMVEVAGRDVVIVMGGDGGMNELLVRSEIDTVGDIRGKALAVDAPDTAYALAAKKILKNNGLLENRDYTVRAVGGTASRTAAMVKDPQLAAGMANPPFSIIVKSQGLKSLGSQRDLIGPYQAGGAFVMRAWAKANAGVLERYIAAYIEAVRLVLDPANRAQVVGILARRLALDPEVARGSYEALRGPGGVARDARFDLDGFRTVLALRAEMEGQWGGTPPAPEKFFDLSYYERALALAGR